MVRFALLVLPNTATTTVWLPVASLGAVQERAVAVGVPMRAQGAPPTLAVAEAWRNRPVRVRLPPAAGRKVGEVELRKGAPAGHRRQEVHE